MVCQLFNFTREIPHIIHYTRLRVCMQLCDVSVSKNKKALVMAPDDPSPSSHLLGTQHASDHTRCAVCGHLCHRNKASQPAEQSNFRAGGKHRLSFFYCELSVPSVLSILDHDASILRKPRKVEFREMKTRHSYYQNRTDRLVLQSVSN
jgi:hypothetical protein